MPKHFNSSEHVAGEMVSFRLKKTRWDKLAFVLLVLFIAAFLIGIIPLFYDLGPQNKATISGTKATLSNVKAALNQFKIEFDRYPTTAEGLDALVNKPASLKDWDHQFMERMPVDGWRRNLVYRCPGVGDPMGYDLYSLGADGKDGTADDISKDDI